MLDKSEKSKFIDDPVVINDTQQMLYKAVEESNKNNHVISMKRFNCKTDFSGIWLGFSIKKESHQFCNYLILNVRFFIFDLKFSYKISQVRDYGKIVELADKFDKKYTKFVKVKSKYPHIDIDKK